MSPASAGNLEVERYIGACLISSQNRVAAATGIVPPSTTTTINKSRLNDFFHNSRDFVAPEHYQPQQQQRVNFRFQRCQDGWAGGVPLISFANHQRIGRRNDQDGNVKSVVVDDHPSSPLARLAVHTQGAPLIVTKNFGGHRKNKQHRNHGSHTKVFENSNIKKQNKYQHEQQQIQQNASTDTVSVTSDESSGSSNNSENCLPRIIKPRKRRKKDRKPPLLGRPLSQDGFSTDSASPDIDNTQTNILSLSPFIPFTFDPYGSCSFSIPESPSLIDRLHILGDISETPKLHHSFEDVEEPDDGKDINGNQPTSTCQCRYCDPAGQIWDVDRSCYSPFLTPPTDQSKTFQFPNLPFSSAISYLEDGVSSIGLEDYEGSKKLSPPSRSSSSSSCRDLEVSTEIVMSLNGHRDLEIRFFSSPSVENTRNKSCV